MLFVSSLRRPTAIAFLASFFLAACGMPAQPSTSGGTLGAPVGQNGDGLPSQDPIVPLAGNMGGTPSSVVTADAASSYCASSPAGLAAARYSAAVVTCLSLPGTSSSAAFPAGSLPDSTELSLTAANGLVSPTLRTKLNEAGTFSYAPAGDPLLVSASPQADASSYFSVTIHLYQDPSVAWGAGKHVVVVYKTLDVSTGTVSLGIIAPSDLTFKGTSVTFNTIHFGAYQAAITDVAGAVAFVATAQGQALSAVQGAALANWGRNFTATVDKTTREALFSTDTTAAAGVTCSAYVSPDKQAPYYQIESPLADLTQLNIFAKSTAAEVLYVQYECDDTGGNTVVSPWYGPVNISAMGLSVTNVPASNQVSSATVVYPTFFGYGVYQLRWALNSGTAATTGGCATTPEAAYTSGWQLTTNWAPALPQTTPGAYQLCVESRDFYGNVVGPFEYNWTYTP